MRFMQEGVFHIKVNKAEYFFINRYFRILSDNQSMSCIISLILIIALQLHKQLKCISNRCVPIVVLNLMSLVYYLNINIKIYLSQQRNSINS